MENKYLNIVFAVASIIVISAVSVPFTYAAAPSSVSNFAGTISGTLANLSWVTPSESDLSEFELRYSTSPLNDGNFAVATQYAGTPHPFSGQTQTMTVSGLSANTTYYFGLKLYNIMGEFSGVAFITISPGGSSGSGCGSPFSVMNFSATPSSASAIVLSWQTQTQSDLSEFDLRYSKDSITEGTFYISTQYVGTPHPFSGQTQTMTVNGLETNTKYYFAIKVFNMCGSASPFVTTSATTNAGGGGGGGGGGGSPITPVASHRILINNDAEKTDVREVTLTLTAVSASQMKISNNADLSGASWEAYTDKKPWILSEGYGKKTVYAKYRNSNNEESTIVSDDIQYGDVPVPTPPPTPTPPPAPIPTPTPVPQPPRGEVLGARTLDFNALMVNWGAPRKGNASDLNKDGEVDNRDVFELMRNWIEIGVDKDYQKPLGTIVSFAPTKLMVVEGQEFYAVVNVKPGETERTYTAQVKLQYPKDLLEFKSVTYWDNWVPVIRPGYDMDDAEKGIIVKTAGYAGGFTDQKVFGVFRFVAKKSGAGAISFGDSAYVLDAENFNKLAGVQIPSVLGFSTLDAGSKNIKLLASILSLGEGTNGVTFFVIFLFFLIVYALYLWYKSRGIEEDEE